MASMLFRKIATKSCPICKLKLKNKNIKIKKRVEKIK
jgi:hypothetical protein